MPPESRTPTPNPRPAFTLIEMLVAMALTLILVYAIAHFYAIIGDAVKDGRAMIELNQQLRACVERLKTDLDQVTIPIVPWADEGGAAGYFEYREGTSISAASDWDVNGNFKLDANYDTTRVPLTDIWPPLITTPPTTTTVNTGPDGRPDFNDFNYTNLLGDTDDILAMTIRAGSVPFSGQELDRVPATGLLNLPSGVGTQPHKITNRPRSAATTAPYAEVVWWTSFSDLNLSATWDLGEPRLLHRRQLLIRPDLNRASDTNVSSFYVKIPVLSGANLNDPRYVYYYDLFQYCDVSMRPAAFAGGFVYFVANSLSDLCLRENRFMHIWRIFESTPGQLFPYALDLNPNYAGSLQPNIMPDNDTSIGTTQTRHPNSNGNPNGASQYRWVLFDGGRKGEDVILSNTLAFDVRLFDPEARVYSDTITNPPPLTSTAVQPGDAGYPYAVNNNFQITNSGSTHQPFALLGTGAYVDLGYGIGLANTLPFLDGGHTATPSNNTNFSVVFGNTPPGTNANISVYAPVIGNSRFTFGGYPAADATLSPAFQNLYRTTVGFTYDTWTLLYERDGIDQDGDMVRDQGTDGIDNNGINGVDDITERETVPPYPTPLRGIQVRIRVYEPNTRQARQATVESDFIPE